MTANDNEIRDWKYVDKAELQAMFEDPCESPHPIFPAPFLPLVPARALIGRGLSPANSFTPWFKLIARDFLFGWWDELLARKDAQGKIHAKSLAGLVDGSKVVKMV